MREGALKGRSAGSEWLPWKVEDEGPPKEVGRRGETGREEALEVEAEGLKSGLESSAMMSMGSSCLPLSPDHGQNMPGRR